MALALESFDGNIPPSVGLMRALLPLQCPLGENFYLHLSSFEQTNKKNLLEATGWQRWVGTGTAEIRLLIQSRISGQRSRHCVGSIPWVIVSGQISESLYKGFSQDPSTPLLFSMKGECQGIPKSKKRSASQPAGNWKPSHFLIGTG